MTNNHCVSCGRKIDSKTEFQHFPCWWGCDEPLRTLRKTQDDKPVCIDCLPDRFKQGNAHYKPILCPADLPKVGEPLPPNTIVLDLYKEP